MIRFHESKLLRTLTSKPAADIVDELVVIKNCSLCTVIQNKVASRDGSLLKLQCLDVVPDCLLVVLENELLPRLLCTCPNSLQVFDIRRGEMCQEREVLNENCSILDFRDHGITYCSISPVDMRCHSWHLTKQMLTMARTKDTSAPFL